ncbi:hypothetical protein Tco_0941413 [Tanacetum coccineum]|uniref:Uncharacterized protein n=1 Tax=Tanacetum coccineum TaxID=301880 RepID=A0ABQ5DTG5_9ASTR
MLTEEEQLAADTMQAIKASKKVSKSQPHTEDSSKGAGVLDEVKGISAAKADTIIDWGSENESDWSDETQVDEEEIEWVSSDEEEEKQDDQDDDYDRSIDIKETDDEDKYAGNEAHEDEYMHEDEYVHNDADEEMKDG